MPVLEISFQNNVTGSLSKPRVFIKGGNQGASSRLQILKSIACHQGPSLQAGSAPGHVMLDLFMRKSHLEGGVPRLDSCIKRPFDAGSIPAISSRR